MALAQALADLQSKIGQEIHTSDWLTVDQAMIDAFAGATRDKQWIHTDPARAAPSFTALSVAAGTRS